MMKQRLDMLGADTRRPCPAPQLRWVLIWSLFLWPLLASSAHAAIYFDENFESTLTGNGWSTDSCVFMGYTSPMPASGCNPFITSEIAHSGTHSLKADYTGNPPSRSGCPNSPTIECGVTAYRTFTASADLWMRFWYRTAPGWTYGSISTKNIYLYAGDNTPSFVWGHHFGSPELQLDAQGIPSQTCPSGNFGGTCSFWPNMASVPLNNDQWYCIETRTNVGTAGGSDAIFEAWINGTQIIGYYNKRALNSGEPDALNQVKIYAQSGSGVMYYDDFALGNARIGCAGGPGGTPPPATDTSPPAAPTNLTVTELWEDLKALAATLWNWLEPVSAEAAVPNDKLTLSWLGQESGVEYELRWQYFAHPDWIGLGLVPSTALQLIVPLSPPIECQAGMDCYVCADARAKRRIDEIYGPWLSETPAGKSCNQFAVGPIVLPPPPVPDPVPTPAPAPPATITMSGDRITIQCDTTRYARAKTTVVTGTKRVITCLK